MRKFILTLILGCSVFAVPALAEGERYKPVDHPATLKECSACHMVFQPQMLPARSWEKLMVSLDDHFGENAELDQAVANDIKAYLAANAADAKGAKSRWLRGIASSETPLRITETPRFKRAHDELSDKAFLRANVGSKANCIACHATADKGLYTEPGEEGEGDGD
jgi:hypothetical protein